MLIVNNIWCTPSNCVGCKVPCTLVKWTIEKEEVERINWLSNWTSEFVLEAMDTERKVVGT